MTHPLREETMSDREHTVEELRRQLDMAVSKLNQAQLAKTAAERRLYQRMCRDSGLMGKKATKDGVSIIVHGMEFHSGKPTMVKGFKINKGGKVGSSERVFYGLLRVEFSDHLPPSPNPSKQVEEAE